jgi:hypothetical protein
VTIAEAVQTVLKDSGKVMNVNEIYDQIIEKNLYLFGAKNPKGVLAQTIREKSSANPKAKQVLFHAVGQGTYTLAK